MVDMHAGFAPRLVHPAVPKYPLAVEATWSIRGLLVPSVCQYSPLRVPKDLGGLPWPCISDYLCVKGAQGMCRVPNQPLHLTHEQHYLRPYLMSTSQNQC